MRYKMGQISLVLGVMLVIMGFATSNAVEWILGLLLLGLGVFDYTKKAKSTKADETKRIDELLKIVEQEQEKKS